MASRVTAPLSILIFCYILIIAMTFLFFALCTVSAYDIYYYFKQGNNSRVMKACQGYFEKEQYGLFEKCYQENMEPMEQHE
ncbi:hypothetical protein ACFL1Y_00295 [Patescibacteria group bacterium]